MPACVILVRIFVQNFKGLKFCKKKKTPLLSNNKNFPSKKQKHFKHLVLYHIHVKSNNIDTKFWKKSIREPLLWTIHRCKVLTYSIIPRTFFMIDSPLFFVFENCLVEEGLGAAVGSSSVLVRLMNSVKRDARENLSTKNQNQQWQSFSVETITVTNIVALSLHVW